MWHKLLTETVSHIGVILDYCKGCEFWEVNYELHFIKFAAWCTLDRVAMPQFVVTFPYILGLIAHEPVDVWTSQKLVGIQDHIVCFGQMTNPETMYRKDSTFKYYLG